jgi:cyclopropane fatty-acyl-phospholipid synthase-like methyltransferase
MAEWFEDWFNTEEYLEVYKNRNEKEALKLVELILENISVNAGAKVLDMACGAGRHSILFSQKGFDVTAVDLSPMLLQVAEKRAAQEKVKIDFIRSDLRKFSVEKKFSLAVNLFTSFGYFEDDEQNYGILDTANKHLKAEGFFVLDYFNKRYIEKNLVPHSEDEIPGGRIIQDRKIEGKRVNKNIEIHKDVKTLNYRESVRMYSIDELKSALIQRKFAIKKVFGDFNGNPFDIETSPRIILISQK